MRILNLGIMAHIDAGKTSLTERLLHSAGVIDRLGSVDSGDTQTDSMALERARGITIRAAVTSFALDDLMVNLIDTPGHPDFIAEVERTLGVLDGAVLVVSAVEGVQAQTRVLMRTLKRLRIPTLIFVNKIDRRGARYDSLVENIAEFLSPAAVPMAAVRDLGTVTASAVPLAFDDPGHVQRLVEVLVDNDDDLMQVYLDDTLDLTDGRLRKELAAQTAQALVHPVYFGSAITGAGGDLLMAAIKELLPSGQGDADGPPAGRIFKIDRGAAGEKIAYVRMFEGTLQTRDRLQLNRGPESKVTQLAAYNGGSAARSQTLSAGQIGKVWGLDEAVIGDSFGTQLGGAISALFSPPTLETVIVASRPGDGGPLYAALSQLAEQDPLINIRRDEIRNELRISLYGEVQKEVIQSTLTDEFDIEVSFLESSTICVERVIGTGAAHERLRSETNPFLAEVGLRVEPGEPGSGVTFHLEIELGSMPLAFIKAVETTVKTTLEQGLHGWEVLDCAVSMTHSGYLARQSHSHGTFDKSMSSTAGDFRNLTPLVLMEALTQAATYVCEPIHRFFLEVPTDTYGAIYPLLARLGAVPQPPAVKGRTCSMEGTIPAARIHELQMMLPSLTHGEGVLESTFERYDQVHGVTPTRRRWDHNPLNRKEYLLALSRVV
ncbi:GTP-binding protein [Streptomyces sp. NPDC058459]|uniref:GTP-binding protein n=1 Tax=Streptomyces sp. NPDC058459 TaxID=3346508 RepID=UPI00365239C0